MIDKETIRAIMIAVLVGERPPTPANIARAVEGVDRIFEAAQPTEGGWPWEQRK